ncbi:SufB/SufD family protein [Alicyclobacillus dauci]|uniref:SufD family Fe-S cluster assembly protein n=1 Tax=Alicyclobacillus dauci TaxID=1475485 RepID=A0ABY6YZ13_9BACL|nr:SufD family Fe-S cluster assembly protein [Alicyclobacillus dauci]WAH35821.1 SufD family Fe-S cluster assembly protein [Alicyclobacillus dauci]
MTEANTVSLQVHSISGAFHEPEWLTQLREEAWQTFDSMPEPRLEKTDLRKRGWDAGNFVTAPSKQLPADAASYIAGLDHSHAVFVDGHLADIKLNEADRDLGVVFTDIHTAASKHEDLVKGTLGTVVPARESKWAALNFAYFAGGVFLYVPRKVTLEKPFEVVHVVTSEAQASFPRSLVVADELADVRFVEVSFIGADRQKFTNSHVLEVVAKSGSHVHVGTADAFHKGPTYFVTRRAHVEKDATVEWTVSDVSNGFAVEVVESVLNGTGARSQTRVLGLGYGREHLDLTASMLHVGRNTESDIVMHSALREKANSIFRSKTQIVKGAVGAGSEQHDRMIMVDGTARADAIPMLLIDENDVQRCGHAASVGKIDPNQIYYLMSRGIPQTQAMKMIIWGYLNDSVETLPSDQIRELVVGRIERELER